MQKRDRKDITIKIDRVLDAKLEALSQKSGKSKTQVLRDVLGPIFEVAEGLESVHVTVIKNPIMKTVSFRIAPSEKYQIMVKK
jgi:hypothetical protein